MTELVAERRLVKSPPELWEELSDAERLARHLGAFGEIRITQREPEQTVAWEGEHAHGTVAIEPSGWGTKVTLKATLAEAEPSAVEPFDEGEAVPEPAESQEPLLDPLPDPLPGPAESEDPALDPLPDDGDDEPAGDELEPAAVSGTEAEPSPAVQAEPAFPYGPFPEVRAEPTGGKAGGGRLGFIGRLLGGLRGARRPAPTRPVEAAAPLEADPPPRNWLEDALLQRPGGDHAGEPASPSQLAEPEPTPAEVEPSEAVERVPVEENDARPAEESDGRPAERSDASPAEPAPREAKIDPEAARAVLDGVLDALGAAHHRPFSRA